MDTKRVVEIKGTKFEFDTREATVVESLCVGDRVSVLIKSYGDSYEVKHGVVVGFEDFKELPTVVIAYISSEFSGGEVKILAWNEKTTDREVIKATDDVLFDKEEGIRSLDKAISKAEVELAAAREKKEYFLKHFQAYWSDCTVASSE